MMSSQSKDQYRKWKTKLNKSIQDKLESSQQELDLDDINQLDELNDFLFDEQNFSFTNDGLFYEDDNNLVISCGDNLSDEDLNKEINKRILSIYVKSKLSNEQMDDILGVLKLVNDYYSDDKRLFSKSKLKIPKNLYSLRKENKLNVPKWIGYSTPCCDSKQVTLDDKQVNCSICNQSISKSKILEYKDCFLFYDLRKFIEFLLSKFELKNIKLSNDNIIRSFYDAEVYQHFLELLNDKIILSMVFNSDGVPIFNSNSNSIWPIYLKSNEIDSKKTENKFLIGCYLSNSSKPDHNFFLSQIVNQLNEIYTNGIYSAELEKLVYPVLFNFILDLPARALFMNHNYYNGEHGCTDCYDKGRRITSKGKQSDNSNAERNKGTVRIYEPSDNMQMRSVEQHREILRNLNASFDSLLGVNGESELCKLIYFDFISGIHPDLMHMIFSGINPRLLNYQLSFENRNKPSYIKKPDQKILDERILKSNYNSDFKRLPKSIFDRNNWKSTQNFDYFFYLGPIVLQSILNKEVYEHYLLLVLIISKLYNGHLSINELNQIDDLVKIFLDNINQFYDQHEYTMNVHQLNHLVQTFKNYGPLKYLTAFPFESFNGDVKKSIKGGFGVLKQIFNRNELKISYDIKSIKGDDKNFKTISKGYANINNSTCYSKIKKNNLIISSFEKSKSALKDYYVKTKDKYFRINYFYMDISKKLYFCGDIIDCLGYLNFKVNGQELNLYHLIKAKQSTIKENIEVDEIEERVLFFPIFVEKSSEFQDPNLGFIIEFKFHVHN